MLGPADATFSEKGPGERNRDRGEWRTGRKIDLDALEDLADWAACGSVLLPGTPQCG